MAYIRLKLSAVLFI